MLASLYSPAVKAYIFQQFEIAQGNDYSNLLAGSVLPSNQPIETYGGLGTVPMLRPWRGNRRAAELRPVTFQIPNDIYEGTLVVTKDDLLYEKTGQVGNRIQGMARRAAAHWRKLISDLIIANPTCYDGVAFFASTHNEAGLGNQTNLVSQAAATATDPTAGEMETAILNSLEALMVLKDDSGEPINEDLNQFMVMVPPIFYAAAAAALNATVIVDAASTGGRTNIIQSLGGKTFSLVSNPRLTATDKAFVFAADGRAFIRQEAEALEITAKAEGSEYYHDTRQHEYGVSVVRAAGVGDWKGAIQITFT